MSSEAILDLLVDACRRGDPYSGLSPFTASVRRKINGPNRDEASANSMLNLAFQRAVIPYGCSECAMELGNLLFLILSSFGHDGDDFGVQRVREVHRYYTDDAESNGPLWWKAHVEFLHSAREWWRASGKENVEFVKFIQEALTNTHLKLFRRADLCGDQSAATDSLAAAFRECLLCLGEVDLIMQVIGEVAPRLRPEEQPFLIARAVHGLLAAGAAARSSAIKLKSLDAAHLLLSRCTNSNPSVVSFLNDLVTILRSPDNSSSLPADQRLHCAAVAALCKAYGHVLWAVSDLKWKELASAY